MLKIRYKRLLRCFLCKRARQTDETSPDVRPPPSISFYGHDETEEDEAPVLTEVEIKKVGFETAASLPDAHLDPLSPVHVPPKRYGKQAAAPDPLSPTSSTPAQFRVSEAAAVVIGISGMGWVSGGLLPVLESMGKRATVIGQDRFWKKAEQVKVRGQNRTSGDQPECIDHAKFAQAIKLHLDTHDFIIAEGSKLLHYPEVVELLSHIFFIEVSKAEASHRRAKPRDSILNPHPLDKNDFEDVLWPAHQRYVQEKVTPLSDRIVALQSPATEYQRNELVQHIVRAMGITQTTQAPVHDYRTSVPDSVVPHSWRPTGADVAKAETQPLLDEKREHSSPNVECRFLRCRNLVTPLTEKGEPCEITLPESIFKICFRIKSASLLPFTAFSPKVHEAGNLLVKWNPAIFEDGEESPAMPGGGMEWREGWLTLQFPNAYPNQCGKLRLSFGGKEYMGLPETSLSVSFDLTCSFDDFLPAGIFSVEDHPVIKAELLKRWVRIGDVSPPDVDEIMKAAFENLAKEGAEQRRKDVAEEWRKEHALGLFVQTRPTDWQTVQMLDVQTHTVQMPDVQKD